MSQNPNADGPVGRRQIVTYNTTGQPSYAVQELTPADFLNPQPGDEFFQGEAHDALVDYLARCLRHLYRYHPTVGVLTNAKIIWQDAALAQPMPDVLVAANLADPHRFRDRLDMAAEGAAPRAILEVTSPRLAQIDLEDKRDLYRRAQVQEYVVVDPAPLRVRVFRLAGDAYEPVSADGDRIYSATHKVWFCPDETGALLLVEERTGRAITPPKTSDEPWAAAQVDAALRAQAIAAKLNLDR